MCGIRLSFLIRVVLIGARQFTGRAKRVFFQRDRLGAPQPALDPAVVLIGWFAVAIALSSLGVYRAAAARFPTIEFGILIPLLLGGLPIWRWPTLSGLIDVLPRQWVIAVQFYRWDYWP
jgi:hypothetical protein